MAEKNIEKYYGKLKTDLDFYNKILELRKKYKEEEFDLSKTERFFEKEIVPILSKEKLSFSLTELKELILKNVNDEDIEKISKGSNDVKYFGLSVLMSFSSISFLSQIHKNEFSENNTIDLSDASIKQKEKFIKDLQSSVEKQRNETAERIDLNQQFVELSSQWNYQIDPKLPHIKEKFSISQLRKVIENMKNSINEQKNIEAERVNLMQELLDLIGEWEDDNVLPPIIPYDDISLENLKEIVRKVRSNVEIQKAKNTEKIELKKKVLELSNQLDYENLLSSVMPCDKASLEQLRVAVKELQDSIKRQKEEKNERIKLNKEFIMLLDSWDYQEELPPIIHNKNISIKKLKDTVEKMKGYLNEQKSKK